MSDNHNSREDYYAAARSWSEGQAQSSARETRIAWRVAIGAAVIALLLALTLLLLVPLKTVQPYVLTVDRQTGAVEPAMAISDGRLTQNEATELAFYLAGLVGRAHGRQMDRATRDRWLTELGKARGRAPGCALLALVERGRTARRA